ncbi:MAG: NfeD family protein [Leptospiraceae bacterium]|nr:NfeD family protein [Leptospiraceae bacterium]MCP5502844.1 NfeD family protein [Leptospiraceae bacterium]
MNIITNWIDPMYLWIILGVVLIVLEFGIPGTFVSFVGVSAIITGLLYGLFHFSFLNQIIILSTLSFLLIFIGGTMLRKFFPPNRTFKPLSVNEEFGKIVPVINKVRIKKKGGKVKYQGTVWEAVSFEEEIEEGQYAKLISRNNLTFLVEKAKEEDVKNFLESQKKETDDFTEFT